MLTQLTTPISTDNIWNFISDKTQTLVLIMTNNQTYWHSNLAEQSSMVHVRVINLMMMMMMMIIIIVIIIITIIIIIIIIDI